VQPAQHVRSSSLEAESSPLGGAPSHADDDAVAGANLAWPPPLDELESIQVVQLGIDGAFDPVPARPDLALVAKPAIAPETPDQDAALVPVAGGPLAIDIERELASDWVADEPPWDEPATADPVGAAIAPAAPRAAAAFGPAMAREVERAPAFAPTISDLRDLDTRLERVERLSLASDRSPIAPAPGPFHATVPSAGLAQGVSSEAAPPGVAGAADAKASTVETQLEHAFDRLGLGNATSTAVASSACDSTIGRLQQSSAGAVVAVNGRPFRSSRRWTAQRGAALAAVAVIAVAAALWLAYPVSAPGSKRDAESFATVTGATAASHPSREATPFALPADRAAGTAPSSVANPAPPAASGQSGPAAVAPALEDATPSGQVGGNGSTSAGRAEATSHTRPSITDSLRPAPAARMARAAPDPRARGTESRTRSTSADPIARRAASGSPTGSSAGRVGRTSLAPARSFVPEAHRSNAEATLPRAAVGKESATAPPPEVPTVTSGDGSKLVAATSARDVEYEVRQALASYRQAYATLDAAAARRIWPGVDERALRRAFSGLESQRLEFDRCEIELSGATATATCLGRVVHGQGVGRQQPKVESRQWVFTLRQAADGWRIDGTEIRR
jgi:hypothetical protein